MDALTMGFGLQALKRHINWEAFEAFIEYLIERENDLTMSAEDGLPTSKARSRWQLATTILPDIDDMIESALSESKENKQKGETNG